MSNIQGGKRSGLGVALYPAGALKWSHVVVPKSTGKIFQTDLRKDLLIYCKYLS